MCSWRTLCYLWCPECHPEYIYIYVYIHKLLPLWRWFWYRFGSKMCHIQYRHQLICKYCQCAIMPHAFGWYALPYKKFPFLIIPSLILNTCCGSKINMQVDINGCPLKQQYEDSCDRDVVSGISLHFNS